MASLAYLAHEASYPIRDIAFEDDDFDKIRLQSWACAMLLLLVGAAAYMTFIIVLRPLESVVIHNPTYEGLQAYDTVVTCDCTRFSPLRAHRLLQQPRCANPATSAPDFRQLAAVAGAVNHVQQYWGAAHQEDYGAFLEVPIAGWSSQWRVSPDDIAAERADVLRGARLGHAMTICLPSSYKVQMLEAFRDMQTCGCHGGLCDALVTPRPFLQLDSFNCSLQRSLLYSDAFMNYLMFAGFELERALEVNEVLSLNASEMVTLKNIVSFSEELTSLPTQVVVFSTADAVVAIVCAGVGVCWWWWRWWWGCCCSPCFCCCCCCCCHYCCCC